jgi:membrane AbrB-like protein
VAKGRRRAPDGKAAAVYTRFVPKPPPAPATSPATNLRSALLSLAVAAAGGGLAHLAGLPAAWLAGSAITVSAAAVAGWRVGLPTRFRDVVFVLLGVSMGSGVTPQSLERAVHWPVSLTVLVVFVVAVIAAAFLFFRRVSGWDRESAFFASIPGALSYVLALAVTSRADIRKVATAQSIRVFCLVAVLPIFIGSVQEVGAPQLPPVGSPLEIAVLIAACAVAGLVAARLKVPAGLLTGAFFASAAAHGSGLVASSLPWWLTVPSFVVLGVVIGSRFTGTTPRLLVALAAASLGGLAVSFAVSLLAALAVVGLTEATLGQALLAYAPGGLEAMIALSLLLGIDPAFVATHQLARFILIALTLPLAARFARLDRP